MTANLGRRAGLRPSAHQALCNSDMAALHPEMKGLPAILPPFLPDLSSSALQVFGNGDMTTPGGDVEGLLAILGCRAGQCQTRQ